MSQKSFTLDTEENCSVGQYSTEDAESLLIINTYWMPTKFMALDPKSEGNKLTLAKFTLQRNI